MRGGSPRRFGLEGVHTQAQVRFQDPTASEKSSSTADGLGADRGWEDEHGCDGAARHPISDPYAGGVLAIRSIHGESHSSLLLTAQKDKQNRENGATHKDYQLIADARRGAIPYFPPQLTFLFGGDARRFWPC